MGPLAFRERGTDVVWLANRFNRCPDRCHQEHLSFQGLGKLCPKMPSGVPRRMEDARKEKTRIGWLEVGGAYVVGTL